MCLINFLYNKWPVQYWAITHCGFPSQCVFPSRCHKEIICNKKMNFETCKHNAGEQNGPFRTLAALLMTGDEGGVNQVVLTRQCWIPVCFLGVDGAAHNMVYPLPLTSLMNLDGSDNTVPSVSVAQFVQGHVCARVCVRMCIHRKVVCMLFKDDPGAWTRRSPLPLTVHTARLGFPSLWRQENGCNLVCYAHRKKENP